MFNCRSSHFHFPDLLVNNSQISHINNVSQWPHMINDYTDLLVLNQTTPKVFQEVESHSISTCFLLQSLEIIHHARKKIQMLISWLEISSNEVPLLIQHVRSVLPCVLLLFSWGIIWGNFLDENQREPIWRVETGDQSGGLAWLWPELYWLLVIRAIKDRDNISPERSKDEN